MSNSARMPVRRKVLFIFVTLVGALLLSDLMLRVASWVSSDVEYQLAPGNDKPLIRDAVLGHRPHPANPKHDSAGFRNERVPQSAAVVALGDSQTYGMNAARDEAWPQRFARLADTTVYNMAYGGYGPSHELALWDEAMQLRPKLVVAAFYAGNDLFDCFDMVYARDQLPRLATREPVWLEQAAKAEALESLKEKADRAFRVGWARSDERLTVRAWLSQHSALYGLVRAIKSRVAIQNQTAQTYDPQKLWNERAQQARDRSDYCFVVDTDRMRTILTPRYRLMAVDMTDPRMMMGHQVALAALKEMATNARLSGVGFAVVLIPTKELACEALVAGSDSPPPREYLDLIHHEKRMWLETERALEREGILFVDVLGALTGAIEVGDAPYSESADGHPNAAGYMAIAQHIKAELEAAGLWPIAP